MCPFEVFLESFNIAMEQSNSIKLVLSQGTPFCSILFLLAFSGYLYTKILKFLLRIFKGVWLRELMMCCPVPRTAPIFPICYSVQLCTTLFTLFSQLPHPSSPGPFLGFPPCLSLQRYASQGMGRPGVLGGPNWWEKPGWRTRGLLSC